MSLSLAVAGLGISPAALRHGGCVVPKARPRPVRLLPVRAGAAGEAKPPPPAFGDLLSRMGGSQAPPSMSDIVWPSAGGFVAMAGMNYVDTLLAPKGLHFTLGSFAAVCTLLFAAPKSPVSQKYNVIVSHLGCAALGVVALAIMGPGWFSRSVALAAAIAFMLFTGSLHPPAAGLPLIMIDIPKFHHLRWWYVLFPGLAGCFFLFLVQEAVQWLKENCKF